jgi:hypothetical protein
MILILVENALLRGSDLFHIAFERSDCAIPNESVLTNVDKVDEGASEHPPGRINVLPDLPSVSKTRKGFS